ncbi:MAG: glycosyltransferase, partial [Candidatus Bathyarchaeia archaeon]
IKAANVVLIPPFFKLYVSSPITLFEYMASRKPIIAPNIPSIREVLENEKDALLYDDVPDLANALIRLLSNAELAEKLAINAYHKVLHKYSHKQRALKIINALKELENIKLG